MRNTNKIAALFLLTASAAYSQLAIAGPAKVQNVWGNCQLNDVVINVIQRQDGSDPINVSVPASACIGDWEGNDTVNGLNGVDADGKKAYNLGYDNMGWLNSANAPYWGNPGAFVTDDDLENLAGNGKVDPGWIFFGKYENSWAPSSSSKEGFDTYNYASDLLTLNCKDKNGAAVNCNGKTSGDFVYKPPVTNPEDLMDLLGANKFFDQVTVVFKAGNAWAMYNFNLAALGLPPVIGTEAANFMFSGTWDISNTFINKGGKSAGLSHVSLWGRDPTSDDTPPPPTDVPAPFSIALTGLALLLLGLQRRRRQA